MYESTDTWERLFNDRQNKDERLERINKLRKQLAEIEHETSKKTRSSASSRMPDMKILQNAEVRRKAKLEQCMSVVSIFA